MVKHYFILAYRKLKKYSLNVIMGCLMLMASIGSILFLLIHLFNGEYLLKFQMIVIFGILFIMAIASINYFHVSSILFLQQKSEYILRIILGASFFDLLLQVIIESLLRTFIATIVALAVADIATPMVNHLTMYQMQLNKDFDWRVLLALISMNGVLNSVALVNLFLHRKRMVIGFQTCKS